MLDRHLDRTTAAATVLGACLALAGLSGCGPSERQGCANDDECRGDRLCSSAGWCVEPDQIDEDERGAPRIRAPRTLVFSGVEVGRPTGESVTIENEGGAPLEIENIELEETTDDDQQEFEPKGSWPDSTSIEPGGELELQVAYRPINQEWDRGTITLETNASTSSDGAWEIQLRATPNEQGEGALRAPETVEFETTSNGQTRTRRFEIANRGTSPVSIREVTFTGDDVFALKFPGAREPGWHAVGEEFWPLSGVPETLEGGEAIDVRARFQPTRVREFRSALEIWREDAEPETSPRVVRFVGTGRGGGDQPCLAFRNVSDDRLDFEVDTPARSARQAVRLEHCNDDAPDLAVERLEIRGTDAGAFELNESTGDTLAVAAGEGLSRTVTFRPERAGEHRAELVVEGRYPEGESQTWRLELTGRAGSYECDRQADTIIKVRDEEGTEWIQSETVEFAPVTPVVLKALDRYEVERWSLSNHPDSSNATLSPNETAARPAMTLDLAGVYRVMLTARTSSGCQVRDEVEIRAQPNSDIYVEMVWRTPADDDPEDKRSTDLDLHYLHPPEKPWNEAPWDIFWQNTTADWGEKRVEADNPVLVRDDTYGQGPESLRHDQPEEGRFVVGVNYYKSRELGPVRATVRIYINGTLETEFRRRLEERFDFWTVAEIEWPSANIYKRDRVTDGFPQPTQ